MGVIPPQYNRPNERTFDPRKLPLYTSCDMIIFAAGARNKMKFMGL